MNKLTVYKQLTTSPADLFSVLKEEIGIKTNCMPFAVKAIAALRTLPKLTESEALNAANVFLANLQTLNQGGIVAEDYDKTDFVKRGKVITISARVDAFYRAAARKGYRITDTIVAVPKEDEGTTYFKENFYNGEIVYTLEDRRFQTDREITAKRIIDNYFSKYICRLEITEINSNKRIITPPCCEMSNAEMLQISSVSDQGIYEVDYKEYKKRDGTIGKYRTVSDKLNKGTFWVLWTGEMVKKTIIRRALKRAVEVLPELKDTIYAFEDDAPEDVQPQLEQSIDIPMETADVDLNNLTAGQRADVEEMLELYKANPKLASDNAEHIKELLEGGEPLQFVTNCHYAGIVCIMKSAKLRPLLEPFFTKGATNE